MILTTMEHRTMYEDAMFAPTQFHGIIGSRFEPHFEPEWGTWCIHDRKCGRLHPCEDEASARREAASLELVRRLVENVAGYFAAC